MLEESEDDIALELLSLTCICDKDEKSPTRLFLNKNDYIKNCSVTKNIKNNAINIHGQELKKPLPLMKVRKLKYEFHVIVQHGEANEKKSTSVREGEEAVGMERGRAAGRHKDLTAALFMRGLEGQSEK